jgi:L-cystine uptake protein TcyP (sodium:dicarboxylate symporter family)
MVKEGAGQHQKYLSGPQIENVIKWNTAYELFNIPCVCLVKLSILLFILRIDNTRRLRVIVWTVIGVLILTNLATELAIAFQCIPLNALWDEKVEGKCIGGVAIGRVGYGQGGT